MLRLILGRAGTGKTSRIIEEIRSRVAAEQGGNVLIVPEQYSHEAEKELLRRCGDSTSLYAEVLSFTRLAHAVAREVGGSARKYADRGGRLLQMALALDRCAGSLNLYGSLRRQPEALRPLLSAMEELHYGCVDSDALREAAGLCDGALRDKLHDLALLRDAMAALEQQGEADPLSRLDALAESIPLSLRLQGAQIYLDGFTDFTAQERQVIRQLWLAGDVTVCLSCDDLNDASEEFALQRRTALRLKEAALEDAVAVELLSVPSRKSGTPLGELEEHLFRYTEEKFEVGDAIVLRCAAGIEEECELAAGEVLRLLRETGCRWRDVAIAVRGFESYRSTLQSVFERYGIPLYVSAKTDVLQKPLPALILDSFALLSGGWSYEDMFSYLKTGLAGLTREDCDELENYVLLWDIRGSGVWCAQKPWRQHPEGYNRPYTDEVNERLARLDALRRRVSEPLRRFEERGRAAETAAAQCEALWQFWEELELEQNLSAHTAALRALGRTQDANEEAQLWDKCVEALEQCRAVLGELPLSQQELGRLFKLLLSEYNVGTIPVAADRVSAGDFDRMRRRSLKHLLLLGAWDERIPLPPVESGVFTGSERAALRELKLELESGDEQLEREFSLLYAVLALPSESLYISRPLYAADGSETRPSFLTERCEKLFSLRETPGDLMGSRAGCRQGALTLAALGCREAEEVFAGDAVETARLTRLRNAAALSRGRLGPGGVQSLYGQEPWLTASRIDTFASCKFQYFLRYGLKAKVRQSAAFSPPELGTFLHYILEQVARAVQEKGGFAAVSDEEVRALAGEATERYIHEELEDFREKSARFVYLFRRLRQSVEQIVLDTAAELRRSDFVPLDFELNFSRENELPPLELGDGESSLVLTGQADRVDGWEKDGKLYLRVVDYKTGKKSFSLTDVYYGLNLQMLLYLFSLTRRGQERYGKPLLPAGVLYVPARDEILRAPRRLTDEEILKEKAKKLTRSGLLLSDEEVVRAMEHGENGFSYLPLKVKDGVLSGDALSTAEQLGQLSGYIEELLGDMAKELRRGAITADPWFQSESESTCLYCSYFDACHFDENADSPRCRVKLKAPEFWVRIRERRTK